MSGINDLQEPKVESSILPRHLVSNATLQLVLPCRDRDISQFVLRRLHSSSFKLTASVMSVLTTFLNRLSGLEIDALRSSDLRVPTLP